MVLSTSPFVFAAVTALGLATLAACGGAGVQPPAGTQGNSAAQTTPRARASWMLPEAQTDDLLYVSTSGYPVKVFSYPGGKLVGEIALASLGICTDSTGHVYLTLFRYYGSQIFVFAHGATKPMRTLDDQPNRAFGCAVNSKNGDLAVTNWIGDQSQPANLSVFPHGRGRRQVHHYPWITEYYFCTYDKAGNLYFDGSGARGFALAELPWQQQTTRKVTLDHRVSWPGGIQWDGQDVAISNGTGGSIDRFALNGDKGKLVGTLSLRGAKEIEQFTIDGATLLAPDLAGTKTYAWAYPHGGLPTRVVGKTGGFGVALSKAPKR